MEMLPKDTRKSLPTITDSAPNFAAWRQYFERHLGWTPWVLNLVMSQSGRLMTVPAEWPSWFDSSFVEDPDWRPVKDPVTPKHMRETLEQLRGRFGPRWGLRSFDNDKRRAAKELPADLNLSPSRELLKTPLMEKAAARYRDVEQSHDPL